MAPYGSDHKPLCMRLSLPHMPTPPAATQQLRWDFHKQRAYSDYIANDHAAACAVHDALDAGDVDLAHRTLTSLIYSAATSAGMLRGSSRTRRPASLPLGQDALAVRAEIRQLRQGVVPVPAGLRQLWRSHVRTARQLQADRSHLRMQEHLRSNPRISGPRITAGTPRRLPGSSPLFSGVSTTSTSLALRPRRPGEPARRAAHPH